jgi:hypothetical protein
VADSVADEVRQHLSQPLLVDAQPKVGRRSGGEQKHVSFPGRLAPVGCDAFEQCPRRNAPSFERGGAGFELRQVEQLLDEGAEPLDLAQHLVERGHVHGLDAVDQVLEPRPERTDRRPELVGCVGDEVAAHAIDRLQLGRHGVERSRQLAHLVTGGGDDPALVVAVGHGTGGCDHLAQRGRHAVGQHLDDAECQQRRRKAGDQRRQPEPFAEGDDADRDCDGGDDDDAELQLDRAQEIERSHSSAFVSSA